MKDFCSVVMVIGTGMVTHDWVAAAALGIWFNTLGK